MHARTDWSISWPNCLEAHSALITENYMVSHFQCPDWPSSKCPAVDGSQCQLALAEQHNDKKSYPFVERVIDHEVENSSP